MQHISEYKAYFESLAAANGLSFVYGGWERVLNRQAMNLKYPVLWLGVPEIGRIRNGGLKKVFDGWMMLLTDAPTGAESEQDDALDSMEQKTELILAKMNASHVDDGLFEFDIEQASSFKKEYQTGDADWGWMTEFKLIGITSEYPDCL